LGAPGFSPPPPPKIFFFFLSRGQKKQKKGGTPLFFFDEKRPPKKKARGKFPRPPVKFFLGGAPRVKSQTEIICPCKKKALAPFWKKKKIETPPRGPEHKPGGPKRGPEFFSPPFSGWIFAPAPIPKAPAIKNEKKNKKRGAPIGKKRGEVFPAGARPGEKKKKKKFWGGGGLSKARTRKMVFFLFLFFLRASENPVFFFWGGAGPLPPAQNPEKNGSG